MLQESLWQKQNIKMWIYHENKKKYEIGHYPFNY